MITAFLALGSNLKSPLRQLHKGLQNLRLLPATYVQKIAPLYFGAAVGRRYAPPYWNTVVKIHTRLPVYRLLHHCHVLEKKQGRIRKIRFASRTLDIDILEYGTARIHSPRLTLPHPRMHERPFVMIPLGAVDDISCCGR
ncbi:MAG: 2-amino-4-hydroxy-6-hydroxymethyldihydropteridine diphosphokinase [Legionellaceae bacterium]|nr:2-amino-4-hydroxy-6-hydroxymethyldihydropteridine diphosphokinase [Legionellaceae bacterium]